MAPSAKVLPLAFLNSSGQGDVSFAIQAIQYAVKRGVKVINASWGGPQCSATLRDLISSLPASGVMFVAAAGNDGVSLDVTPSFPASFAGMGMAAQITVGASTNLDLQAGFSNYSYTSVQLLAPGMAILSTIPGNQTATYDGTSMATPYVSGAAALLWSDRPKATLADIRAAILAGIDKGDFAVQTLGRLNVATSLTYLEAHVSP
jgi:subtilisin family serine protease